MNVTPSWSPAARARSGASSSPRLRDAGRDVRVLSRHGRASGDGIEFVTGDLPDGRGDRAPRWPGPRRSCTARAAARATTRRPGTWCGPRRGPGARHLVYISVVGADRIPVVSGVDRAMFGYFASKLAAERVVADSGLPWTTLRATQFHDLILTVARADGQAAGDPGPGRLPVPAGRRRRGGGPARRAGARHAGRPGARHGRAAGVRDGRPASAATCGRAASTGRSCRSGCPARPPARFRAGANLAPDRAVGRRTWEEFLAERVSPSGNGSSVPA